MANILIYIELKDGVATPGALFAINEGRRVASELGATLYALLPCDTPPTYSDNDIITVLADHGADKVILLTHPDLPDDQERQAEALTMACDRFPPRLLLLPPSAASVDLAPRLSLRLGGDYWSLDRVWGDDDADPTNRASGRPSALDSLWDAQEPLVISLESPGQPRCMGDEEAEVIVLHVGKDG